jgi:ATP synthase protein I
MTGDRPPTLEDLDARLRKAREQRGPAPDAAPARDDLPRSILGMAFRIGIELVAAVGIGLAMGLLIDRWLDTTPWGLLLGFLLGSGAGILNVYRAVNGLGLAAGYRPGPGGDDPKS